MELATPLWQEQVLGFDAGRQLNSMLDALYRHSTPT